MTLARALSVRVREAIRARGLALHDAFVLFDYDRNGLLDLAEVFGALSWLGVPVDAADVLFLVRGVTREAHLTFPAFMELFAPGDDGDGALLAAEQQQQQQQRGGEGAEAAAAGRGAAVLPRGAAELQALLD